ncbi:glycoside hydrolase family protein [Paenibacillus sp. 19GGS1-52]|uniref:glycoside hydrolase family protein n=1 Tax=Paenibacillus sp. 19GGS1-52 TaxID=2758563 RepID=UPI001EFA464C|nr:glycoside hydrolase family protein [Paenibacillus sp. 19GGS1-52]ULO09686.1 glycoside hydrolase family protein [Paenibacillus sp. 19GGS1-52]
MSRKISQAGISLIKSFEGCRLAAYKPVQTETYYTIGWGHYGSDVKKGSTITQSQADDMLVSDLAKYESYVNDTSYVPVTAQLNQYQFDALVSFCYNCGNGNLRALCKGRSIKQISESIFNYNKSSGTVLAGLVRRRNAELELFNKVEQVVIKPETTGNDDVQLIKQILTKDNSVHNGFLKDNVNYVPAEVIEALGHKVSWDNVNKKLYIS